MDVQELQQTKLITAIKTPYELNGRIDLPAFDRHVDNQVLFLFRRHTKLARMAMG
jgi:hypothetical protein